MLARATILGNVGKKQCKIMKTGGRMFCLSVASESRRIDHKGNIIKITNWHYVNVFRNLVDFVEKYVQVGDLVYIEGDISNKRTEDGRWLYSVQANIIKGLHSNYGRSFESINDMQDEFALTDSLDEQPD